VTEVILLYKLLESKKHIKFFTLQNIKK